MSSHQSVTELKNRMSKSIIGQDDLIERMLIVLLADGNMLLEGLPGLAKTRAIKSLAKELDCGLSRIQFTPDLLPSDVTGTEIYQPELEEKFLFQQGPIFGGWISSILKNPAPSSFQTSWEWPNLKLRYKSCTRTWLIIKLNSN